MTAVEGAVATLPPATLPTATLLPRRRSSPAPVADAAAPRVSATLERRTLWERRYRTRLQVTDSVIVLVTAGLTSAVTLQVGQPMLLEEDPWILARIPVVTALVWLFMLTAFGTRSSSITGSGATEYKRVVHATGFAFGLLAMAFILFQWQGIRTQLMFSLPLGLVILLAARWAWRKWLISQRRVGHYLSRALVVGGVDDVHYVVERLADPGAGYQVVGAAITDHEASEITIGGVSYPVVAEPRKVAKAAAAYGADTIVVTDRPDADPDYIKRLSWQLEGTAKELVLSSRLADVAGPRISLRPVDGLPLIHVRIPTFEGGRHVLKRALDIGVSTVALLAIAPVALVIASLIKLEDGGPVFFRQRRVGRDGHAFSMVKFRSMRVDAESLVDELMADNDGAGPLFKMRNDPRITRVGRILRKYSLDELPQFWNVLIGDMSVVGPRPPLPAEVTSYNGTVLRRLYIKPGITGPWQVGGRSDLSWDESVRLDLRYVENWSVMNDLMIMWRTAKVMISPSGAY